MSLNDVHSFAEQPAVPNTGVFDEQAVELGEAETPGDQVMDAGLHFLGAMLEI